MQQHTRTSWRTRTSRRYLTMLAVATTAMAAAALALAGPVSAGPASLSASGRSTSAGSAVADVTKIEATAGTAAGLAPTINAYRALLGEPNNGSTVGSQPSGRREINWDGVPDDRSAPNPLPRDFFNTTAPRGAVFSSSAGSQFQVSADATNPTWTPVRFGNINPQYPSIFATFSPERLFTPVGTNQFSIRFFEPGSTRPATVQGFGAIFTDVDRADSTKIELYDRWGGLLWWQNVLRGPQVNNSLSFLGVKTTADIYEVRITAGNTRLSSTATDGSTWDVVAMDDFLYAEPQPLS